MRGYDGHLIIKNAYNAIQSLDKHVDISAIPNRSEKFMSISIGYLRLIDSMQFMPCSVEKLVENLYDKKDKFKNVKHMKKSFQ